eukprot:SAG31_NODE_7_length_42755_cov_130.245728_34_plen_107_part_00
MLVCMAVNPNSLCTSGGKIGSGEKIPASQVAALGEALAAASSAPEPVAEQHDTSSSVPAAQLEGTGTARGLSRPLTDAERAQLLLSGLFVDDIDEAVCQEICPHQD